MNQDWHNTQNSEDTDAFSREFWAHHHEDLQTGQFWADKIKALRGQPVERLRLALGNLPLPAAFREAIVAIRVLIRQARREKESYREQLMLLYWLAAVNSFSIPYSPRLKEPGFNVLQAIPGKVLKSLPFSYAEVGYGKLELLNKTDVKWLTESWGEPSSHTTLHCLHQAVWKEYEDQLLMRRLTTSL